MPPSLLLPTRGMQALSKEVRAQWEEQAAVEMRRYEQARAILTYYDYTYYGYTYLLWRYEQVRAIRTYYGYTYYGYTYCGGIDTMAVLILWR